MEQEVTECHLKMLMELKQDYHRMKWKQKMMNKMKPNERIGDHSSSAMEGSGRVAGQRVFRECGQPNHRTFQANHS